MGVRLKKGRDLGPGPGTPEELRGQTVPWTTVRERKGDRGRSVWSCGCSSYFRRGRYPRGRSYSRGSCTSSGRGASRRESRSSTTSFNSILRWDRPLPATVTRHKRPVPKVNESPPYGRQSLGPIREQRKGQTTVTTHGGCEGNRGHRTGRLVSVTTGKS